MNKDPIDVFDNWALIGRDERMAKGHAVSVKEMLKLAITGQKKFSFLDVGCGNGWVVRKMAKNNECLFAACSNTTDKFKFFGSGQKILVYGVFTPDDESLILIYFRPNFFM